MNNLTNEDTRILIHENGDLFEQLLTKGKGLFPTIHLIREGYLKTKLGPFDNQAYRLLLTRGSVSQGSMLEPYATPLPKGLNKVKEDLLDAANKRFEALNIPSELLRKEAMEGVLKPVEEIRLALEKLQRDARYKSLNEPDFPLELISIDQEENPQITDEAEEQLKDRYCRTYLNSQEEADLYTRFQAVADACTELEKALKSRHFKMPQVFSKAPILSILQNALQSKNGQLGVNPAYVDWVIKQQQQSSY